MHIVATVPDGETLSQAINGEDAVVTSARSATQSWRFRALLLKGTDFAQATCGAIRLNFSVGAVVRRNMRQLYCSLSSSCTVQGLFLAVARRILLLS